MGKRGRKQKWKNRQQQPERENLVSLPVVSVILSEDLCDFEVEEENYSATEMCANVNTDIRLLLPRRLESLDDAFFQFFFRSLGNLRSGQYKLKLLNFS